MNKYNIWNKWDPLKTVMLGDCYQSEFFRDIKNNKARSALQRIADETQEDLSYFESVLKQFGCNVLRPNLDPNDSIMNYVTDQGQLTNIPRPPLQPRDTQIVAGQRLFLTNFDHYSIVEKLNEYNSTDIIDNRNPKLSENDFNALRKKFNNTNLNDGWGNWPSYNEYVKHFPSNRSHFETSVQHYLYSEFDAPSITVCGKDIYIDRIGVDGELNGINTFTKQPYITNNFDINRLTIGGHNDAQFALLKPGAIFSLNEIQNYSKTFPDWDVCYLPKQSWDKVQGFLEMKQQVNGSWWVPSEEDNTEFTQFVQTWLQDWVGYCEETVFDVNCLVLDEHHVCISNPNNNQVNQFLKKHNMEAIHIPWRHRYFWDGGLHCITLDLYREGNQKNYLPNKTECVVCEGYLR